LYSRTTLNSHSSQHSNVDFNFFSDGINSFRVSKATGEPLPNPRIISNRISFALGQQIQNKKVADDLVTANFVFFGQFVDHDFDNTFPKPIKP
jgi:hypothetical protein